MVILLIAVMVSGIFSYSSVVRAAAAEPEIVETIENTDTNEANEAAESEPVNLFNKDDSDIWLQALSYRGSKLVNTNNYANIFTTHKIEVANGDILYWGGRTKDMSEYFTAAKQICEKWGIPYKSIVKDCDNV